MKRSLVKKPGYHVPASKASIGSNSSNRIRDSLL